MQRFKTGDAVVILPKFAYLYPAHSALVLDVKPTRFRPAFNAYTIQFPGGATDVLFEFQLIEGVPGYETAIAVLVFDSRLQTTTGTRGQTSGRQLILQTPGFDIDMKTQNSKSHASIIGQILQRGTNRLSKHVQVSLLKDNTPVDTTTLDSTGMFKFSSVPRGSLNLLVVIPKNLVRILGAFSI